MPTSLPPPPDDTQLTAEARERLAAHEAARQVQLRSFGWEVLADLLQHRWRILGFSTLSALAAVVVALLLPNEYVASARLLVPETNNSLLAAFAGGQRSAAARFLTGGATSTYTRPLAILTSRNVAEAVVDSFDLVKVYEIDPGPTARQEALDELAVRANFGVDSGYEYLNVSVKDRDPRRAAEMANYFVHLLNLRSNTLATQTASGYRQFLERRYEQANLSLDSLLDAVRAFQQRNGVIDLQAQSQAYFSQLGLLRSEQARLQVQVQGLEQMYGPEAPEVQAAQQALAEATRLYQQALGGHEQAFPVARGQVPQVVREYADLERERVLQKSVLETLTPMVEAARMEEMRQVETVQVVDMAVPPVRKSEPKRSIIVLATALSALLLALAAAVLHGQWRRNRVRVEQALLASEAPPSLAP